MKKSRVLVCALLLFVYFGFMIYKLADIQLFSTEAYGPNQVNLLEQSVEQRTTEIQLSNGRGYFLDRNNEPLGNSKIKDVVLFPFIHNMEIPSNISSVLSSIAPDWKVKVKNSEKPIFLSELSTKPITSDYLEQIEQAGVPGIITVEKDFAKDPTLASHLVGLVRNNPEEYRSRYDSTNQQQKPKPIGISGLQKAFDPFLLPKQQEKIMYHVDALGNPLLGLDLRYVGDSDHFYPLKIATTIDSPIQQMVERTVDFYGLKKGGVIILDVRSNELVSMVSRPNINTEQPFANNSIQNQMLTTQFPGSVFKTVVAAAAIENNQLSLNKSYNCNLNLYGDGPSSRQLGSLSFSESFAMSCNYTFATIANQLVKENREILEDYAEKLGLLGPVGWSGNVFHLNNFKQFPEEEVGKIWGNAHDPFVSRAISQTAIGQKEVKVTPLAVANMISTIVNNGVKRDVRVVDEILYNNETVMKEFETNIDRENEIEKETAVQLKRLLTEVVETGTGYKLKGLPIAGKSGTAEIGKKEMYNHWFAGFFPIESPRYAMVVVDLEQTSGNAQTYPIYKELVSKIVSSNHSGSP